MPTIKDVAKKAGVSISTASYALNDQPNVHPETKARILSAAKELSYHPHGIARNLKKRQTKNVGVFIYAFGGPVFSETLEGIRQTLQEHEFNIIVSSGTASLNLLLERQVDGAIVFDNHISDDVLKHYAAHGMPLIVLDRLIQEENIFTSLIENEHLVIQLITDMIHRGYKRFAYLAGPETAFNNRMRFKGFEKALKQHHLNPYDYYQGDFTIQGGYQIGKQLLKKTERPDFIFCANDESAIGLMQALKESGIKIPQDIAIAGFDHIPLGQFMTPKLTTIGIDHQAWGRMVAKAMVDVLKGESIKGNLKPIGKILVKESC
ncbi:MAG: LacI family transcriptional regulator [Acholeplasma sp.]|jgi:LacI family transcriptional regulator|nr:MAG: LacI family transcriptional regulator [Acholeplasma sp.]